MDTIKAKTALDKQMQRELSGGTVKLAAAFLAAGVVGIIAFAVFQIIAFFVEIPAKQYFFVFIVFVIFIAIGFYLEYRVGKMAEKTASENKTNEYEFSESSFIVKESVNGKVIAERTVPYNAVVKVKESKHFLFLFMNPTSAYPVAKNEISEYIERVKNLIKG